MKQRLLSISDFTKVYRISRSTLYRELTAGRLRKIKVGSRAFITSDDGERWLENLLSMTEAQE